MDRWPSGRRRTPGKCVDGESCLAGSNPALSAIKPRWGGKKVVCQRGVTYTHRMKNILIMMAVVVVTAFVTVKLMASTATKTAATQHEAVYERVLRTGTIRCGWLAYPPFFSKDLNTGKLSGMTVEMMEAIAKSMGLKVEWTAETSMSTAFTDMQAGRFDVACIPFWVVPARVKAAWPTVPLYYDGYFGVTRQGGKLVGASLEQLNSPEVHVVVQEGEAIQYTISNVLPKAKIIYTPSLVQPSQKLIDVVNHKADVAFIEMSTLQEFSKEHPNKLVKTTDTPLLVNEAVLWLPQDAPKLLHLFNSSIKGLQYDGTFSSIISRYGSDNFIEVSPPWAKD